MEEFIKRTQSSKGKISLSILLMVTVVSAVSGFYLFTGEANAASLTSIKDVLNNSAPGATSTHTITFTTPTGVAAGETILITFPTGFTTGTVEFGDIDVTDDAAELTLADTPSGATWGATTTGQANGIVITSGSGTIAADSVVVIEIGDNATQGATGNANITNPSKSAAVGTADIYTIAIAGTQTDSGNALVAIVEGVAVSVTIDESLSFAIDIVTNASCDTTFGTHAGPDSTTSTIPFGTLTSGNTFNHACQLLTVSTNASSGFAVTAQSDSSLKTGSGVLINNGTCDGTCSETATDTWATATNNGFGYACDGNECDLVASSLYRNFACSGATTTSCLPGGGETAQTIMASSTVVSNVTTTIEYKLSFSGTQPAGTYSNTVTYVATPTF